MTLICEYRRTGKRPYEAEETSRVKQTRPRKASRGRTPGGCNKHRRRRRERRRENPEATGRDTGTQERSETPAGKDRRREKRERRGKKEGKSKERKKEGGGGGGKEEEAPGMNLMRVANYII